MTRSRAPVEHSVPPHLPTITSWAVFAEGRRLLGRETAGGQPGSTRPREPQRRGCIPSVLRVTLLYRGRGTAQELKGRGQCGELCREDGAAQGGTGSRDAGLEAEGPWPRCPEAARRYGWAAGSEPRCRCSVRSSQRQSSGAADPSEARHRQALPTKGGRHHQGWRSSQAALCP